MSKRPHQDLWAHVNSIGGSVKNLNGRVLSWTEKVFTGKEDAVQPEHLGDKLMGANVDLEFGGGLQELSYTGEFPDCRQEAMVHFIQPVFFRRGQHHGTFVEPPGGMQFSMLDSQPAHANAVHQ